MTPNPYIYVSVAIADVRPSLTYPAVVFEATMVADRFATGESMEYVR